MKLPFRIMLFCLPVLLLSGCYGRTTSNYDEIPELEYGRSALLETSDTHKDDVLRLKKLEELEKMPGEVYTINAGDTVRITVYNHSDLNVKTTINSNNRTKY